MLTLTCAAAAIAADAAPAPGATAAINTATVPAERLELDSYDWYQRHADVLATQKAIDPEVVLIGDSITHFWGGEPRAHHVNGPQAWAVTFGGRRVLNLGFGWDRTQNVLWRLDHGELHGLTPKTVVVNIGTNNFTGTAHARTNSPAEVRDGILAICDRIRAMCPDSRIIVMGVLPRGHAPGDWLRGPIAALNQVLAVSLQHRDHVTFLDIGPRFLRPDGRMAPELMPDGTHPGEPGYRIWGDALLECGL